MGPECKNQQEYLDIIVTWEGGWVGKLLQLYEWTAVLLTPSRVTIHALVPLTRGKVGLKSKMKPVRVKVFPVTPSGY